MAGPEGVLAEARVVTSRRALPLAAARGGGPAAGPRARARGRGRLRRHRSVRARSPACGWGWAPCRGSPSPAGDPASASRPSTSWRRRRPARRGRSWRSSMPSGARCTRGCTTPPAVCVADRAVGPLAARDRRAAHGLGLRRGSGRRAPGGDPARRARAPSSRPRPRFSPHPSPPSALRLCAAGATVAPSALRPLYLRGADIRPPRP